MSNQRVRKTLSFRYAYLCRNSFVFVDVKCFLFVCTDSEKYAVIKSPRKNDVVHVDLGKLQTQTHAHFTFINDYF